MSAFLGPIHYRMYRKIQSQDALTKEILAAYPGKHAEYYAALASACGELPEGELSEIIDESNIHGWLQDKVSLAERRLACAVKLVTEDGQSEESILAAARHAGEKTPIAHPENASTLFQELQNLLLDGMPCDHVNEIVSTEENEVSWRRSVDLHSSYWTEAGADPEMFDRIRDAWISGMLAGSGFSCGRGDGLFFVSKDTE